MPYDTGAPSLEEQAATSHQRGPLRPSRLASARARLTGDALAQLVQGCDLAILAGLFLWRWAAGMQGASGLLLLLIATALVAGTLGSLDAYQLGAREPLHRHLYRVVGAVGGSCLIMLTLLSLTAPAAKAANVLQIVDWCLSAVGLLCAAHLGWFLYIRQLRRQGQLTPNLIIVGATPAAERLIAAALASRDVNILGIFDDRAQRIPKHILGVPVLGRTSALKEHRLLPYVDRIIVAVPSGATARIAQLIEELAPVPNAISLMLDGYDPLGEREAHDRLLEMPLAHLAGARRGGLQAFLKRTVDIVLSVGGLIALTPALIAIAVAIRLDSPGPVLFKQRRHGYLNEEVVVWKFRSMRTEASDYAAARQVTANDDRVTKVGAFLRRTSLDELPQLWNVVRGEMSLVGPRPHAIGMLASGKEASKLVESYAHRHRMKPGLTGWAAINGSRGPADTPEAIRRRVALDLEYVERQSFWFDLSIILRTLPCVLGDTQTVR